MDPPGPQTLHSVQGDITEVLLGHRDGRFLILPMIIIVSLYLVSDHKYGVLEKPIRLQHDVFYSNADESKISTD